jgi:hypothetical protein
VVAKFRGLKIIPTLRAVSCDAVRATPLTIPGPAHLPDDAEIDVNTIGLSDVKHNGARQPGAFGADAAGPRRGIRRGAASVARGRLIAGTELERGSCAARACAACYSPTTR